jgi:hypothetical protein
VRRGATCGSRTRVDVDRAPRDVPRAKLLPAKKRVGRTRPATHVMSLFLPLRQHTAPPTARVQPRSNATNTSTRDRTGCGHGRRTAAVTSRGRNHPEVDTVKKHLNHLAHRGAVEGPVTVSCHCVDKRFRELDLEAVDKAEEVGQAVHQGYYRLTDVGARILAAHPLAESETPTPRTPPGRQPLRCCCRDRRPRTRPRAAGDRGPVPGRRPSSRRVRVGGLETGMSRTTSQASL